MNNDDDVTPANKRQPTGSDLGPEPEWLLDDDLTDVAPEPVEPPVREEKPTTELRPVSEPIAPVPPTEEKVEEPVVRRSHPWLWAVVPLVLLLATGVIAWFGTTQSLNDLTTWEAVRAQIPPLVPARWAMMTWWIILPLLAAFLVYGMLPTGREITRIKLTGPLVSAALVGTSLWIFAQHWQWEVVGLVSVVVATLALLSSYLLAALAPGITKIWQQLVTAIPLSAALAYGTMLTILSWQSYSSQPFGERGSSILFLLLLVLIAAVFSFFLRNGVFALILTIWFAGVAQQQWGDDTVISLSAIVALLFTAALAGLGVILATESHRPSLTTNVGAARSRTSFFRKSQNQPQE